MATQVATKYDVGGVLLDRPFKIRRLGHFGLNLTKFEEGVAFYRDLLGFRVSDTGAAGYFMRYGSDHHALNLADKKERDARAQGDTGGSCSADARFKAHAELELRHIGTRSPRQPGLSRIHTRRR